MVENVNDEALLKFSFYLLLSLELHATYDA